MSDLYVTWPEYHSKIEQLAVTIAASNWKFNQILCLARGGLRVGDVLSRMFKTPLAILAASSYGGTNDQVRGELTFAKQITMTTPSLGDRILLVDDMVDSGMTLAQTLIWLEEREEFQLQEVKTAVLWYKAASSIAPDFYVEYLSENPWIHQPFEKYERWEF